MEKRDLLRREVKGVVQHSGWSEQRWEKRDQETETAGNWFHNAVEEEKLKRPSEEVAQGKEKNVHGIWWLKHEMRDVRRG